MKTPRPYSGAFDTDSKQALRRRRFLMSVATYAACGLFAEICALLGYLPAWLPAAWGLAAAAANGVFYWLLRSGLNLRFKDPSMTEAQLAVSMVAVMVLVYHADAARGAFLMLFPVPLLFGVLRLRLYQLARVGGFGIFGYAVVIALLSTYHPERVRMGVELVNLTALTTVMVFVSLMCSYISQVRVDLSHSLVTIRELAQRDALTGVFNRHHLMETMALEVMRCDRKARRGLVVCMVDIDHFKRINDTFGHPIGDEVLIAVGKRLADSIRSIDYLARYGGEEFLVLLDIDLDDDWPTVCERMRVHVAALSLAAVNATPLSVSIGIAVYGKGDTAVSLLKRADMALYRAKDEGRNRICVADSTPIAAS